MKCARHSSLDDFQRLLPRGSEKTFTIWKFAYKNSTERLPIEELEQKKGPTLSILALIASFSLK